MCRPPDSNSGMARRQRKAAIKRKLAVTQHRRCGVAGIWLSVTFCPHSWWLAWLWRVYCCPSRVVDIFCTDMKDFRQLPASVTCSGSCNIRFLTYL